MLRCFSLLLLLLWLCPARAATTTSWEDAGLMVDHWTTDDGLPLQHTISIAVSPAGFVWISTLDGLVRFDGVEFKVLRRGDYPEMPTNRLLELAAGEAEEVWVVAETGELLRFDGQGFEVWSPERAVYGALRRLAGQLVVTGGGVSLSRVGPEGPVPVAGLPPDLDIQRLVEVRGEVWGSALEDGVWRVPAEGPAERVQALDGLELVRGVVADPAGGLWVGAADGLWRLGDAGLERLDTGRAPLPVVEMAYTDQLWVLDQGGWWTWDGARAQAQGEGEVPFGFLVTPEQGLWRCGRESLVIGEGLSWPIAAYPRGMAWGPDGSVWIGSNGEGLYRFRRPSVRTLHPELGDFVSVLVEPGGETWARTLGGLIAHLAPDGSLLPAPTLDGPGKPYNPPGLGLGPDGALWLAAPEGMCIPHGASCAPADPGLWGEPRRSAVVMLVDRAGRIWLGDSPRLTLGVQEGGAWVWSDVTPEGAPPLAITGLSEAPDGRVWVSTRGQGIYVIGPEGAQHLGAAEGLLSQTVRSIYAGDPGGVWAGTEDVGLCYIPDPLGEIRCLGVREGLSDDVVHSLLVDEQGRMWMSGNRGVSWVQRAQLEAWAAGERDAVLSLGLDEGDGMVSLEANGGHGPAGAKGPDGRLWFPTVAGLAVVDPGALPVPEGPRVFLEALRVGESQRDLSGPLSLGSDEREIAVRWTVPETVWPDQVRYRYRLHGLEEAWQGPVSAREARWTNLPPGELRVEVQAALGGDWGPIASLPLRRAPAFVETRAFLALLGLSGLGLGAVLLLWQGVQNRRRRGELEAIVAARTEDLARKNSELTLTSARLAEADALRTRLIADLSHELRTPLTLVSGPLEDLAESGAVPEGAAQARLDVVRQNAQRLEELVDQLLDLTRLESGKLMLRVRRLDLAAFLRRLAGRFEAQCAHRGLDLRVEVPAGEVSLFFDADLLDKIVSNLLSNALKFTPDGGRITLLLELPEDEDAPAFISVQDTGVGVPEAQQARLFDRFVQGDSGDARRFEGVGIGLALARDLVTLHGGDIGVESAPGEGSTFWFTLPRGVDHLGLEDVALSAEPGPEAAAPPVASLPLEGAEAGELPELIVVEDHPDMRDFLVSHLQRAFRVRAASRGAEALALARDLRPAAIVSDVMMPEMDGLELCRQLRADPQLREVPVLLASAKASEADRVAGLELADDYMSKPLRMRELLARVAKLVARAPAGEQAEEAEAPALGLADEALRERIEATIAAHLGEAGFGVEEMARALAYSRRQLLREVRRVTGESPSDLLRARRMERGRDLLESGAVSTVSEAAAQVGLSAAYFSRTYTAWYGKAPRDALLRGAV